MNDTLIIQQVYPSTVSDPLLELSKEYLELNKQANEPYCEKHQMDYWSIMENLNPQAAGGFGSWTKIPLILRGLEAGYKNVIWLDVDAVIWRVEVDLREACAPDHIGVCYHRIPQLHHWNVGVGYYGNSERVQQFVRDWFDGYPGLGDGWAEQGVFNKLGMRDDIVQTISDKWNSTIQYTEVPDAVVIAYHGAGNPRERYRLVQDALAARKDKYGY